VEARVDDAFRLWLETVPLVELPPARAVLTPEEGTTAAGAVLAADTEVTVVALMIGTGMRVERAEEVATGATSALDSTAEEMEEATTLDTTALETDSTAEETEAAALGADEATTAEEAASVTGAWIWPSEIWVTMPPAKAVLAKALTKKAVRILMCCC
jgi:hypothetical protein